MYEKLPEELAGSCKLRKRKNNHKEEYNVAGTGQHAPSFPVWFYLVLTLQRTEQLKLKSLFRSFNTNFSTPWPYTLPSPEGTTNGQ